MKEEKLQALIALLDDPDQAVFEQVEKELLQEDAAIIGQLEQIWETSLDHLLQSRIENLVQQIQFRETSKKIKSWSKQMNVDLFEGFFLISQYQYPELKVKAIKSKIQKISSDVWLEISNKLTSIEKITVLNHLFYDVHKFTVNMGNLHSPQNCYLNQLLETKKGNPVSIAILYTLVARELGFPVQLIDFPRNPLLAYIDPETARKAHGKDYNSPVLFYINPSNKGAIIGRKEIDFFLKKNEQVNEETFYQPCEDRVMIKKLLESLIEAYNSMGYQEKVDDLTAIAGLL
ncbi:transglutaminase-like domain-containing protein [Gaoshiqia sediminis]|uniref:Transglutaminase-like domain-containing protein n=1 Tax=Gaoshiqia sediminis TaxID=2986998 RepID=A0AA41Y2G4_9BACT|nr:transglutaminase-like domain-containing protein [Gaoshiqia sediminis]MCW0482234.1 transglutaminase-like domain-containing protein [Gaoshiqia sediminis]